MLNRKISTCCGNCLALFLNNAGYQVFVGARLHVTGGVLRGGRAVEGEATIAGNFQVPFWFIAWMTIFN